MRHSVCSHDLFPARVEQGKHYECNGLDFVAPTPEQYERYSDRSHRGKKKLGENETPGELGRTIGKTRGALRGMWMDMVPKFHEGNLLNREAAGTAPGKGFGGGPGPVGRPEGGSFKDKRQDDADVEVASEQASGLARDVLL